MVMNLFKMNTPVLTCWDLPKKNNRIYFIAMFFWDPYKQQNYFTENFSRENF